LTTGKQQQGDNYRQTVSISNHTRIWHHKLYHLHSLFVGATMEKLVGFSNLGTNFNCT